MTGYQRTVGPSRTRRKHADSLLRVGGAGVVATALGALLTACAATVSSDWREDAAIARPATAALAAYDFDAVDDLTVIADRFLDQCGEIASEQDGRRDDDPRGHACTAVRTVVLTDHAGSTTQQMLEQSMRDFLKGTGLGVPPSDAASAGVDYQLDPVDGVRHRVRGFAGNIAGTEPIAMFDSSPPWLHEPDILSESTVWAQGILDDPDAFPRPAIIVAVSATYFDSTRN